MRQIILLIALLLYCSSANAQSTNSTGATLPKSLAEFRENGQFGERVASFTIEPEVKVTINAPDASAFSPTKKILLIFYALPNGNTTAQTFGHKLHPGDDWHFDVQHIGAQTRFLRQQLTNCTVVVAYLEAAQRSWPTWRKIHGDLEIPKMVDRVRAIFSNYTTEIVLSGHSGGGRFIFGYIDALERIPDDVTRIAFLDSDYAYDPKQGHDRKLVRWLEASQNHCLSVFAYNDTVALFNGKPFVSASGGTWGHSHAMLQDLGTHFKFSKQQLGDNLEDDSALNGRIQFLLKENPEHKIFHTVQVEHNGFIHAIVSGTANQDKGYQYFGPRAYTNWISDK